MITPKCGTTISVTDTNSNLSYIAFSTEKTSMPDVRTY